MANALIIEYARTECPACRHKGWCGRRDDGLVLCKRPPTPREVCGLTYKGMAEDGATAMYVEQGREHAKSDHSVRSPAHHRRTSQKLPSIVLEERFQEFESHFGDDLRTRLADALQMPVSSLSLLRIGWWPERRWWNPETRREEGEPGCWTFAEHDALGRIIGIGLRWPHGKKGQLEGGRRGLTLPSGWTEMPDPVFVAEGPSDVLAGRSVGLNVFGRPSNTGGAELIAQVCQSRQVVVLGENDQRNNAWPGKQGVAAIVPKLETAWKRPVPSAFPPDGIKDLRDWVIYLNGKGLSDVDIRTSILDAVRPSSMQWTVGPPDKRGRVNIKVFRWSDGATGAPIHSDRLMLEDAAARRRFVRAVRQVEPGASADEITAKLLAFGQSILSEDTGEGPTVGNSNSADDRSPVFLPGGNVSISDCGEKLGQLLATPQQHFFRGGAIVTVTWDDFNEPMIEPLRPAHMASVVESVATLLTYVKRDDEFHAQRTVCSEQQAKLIMHSTSFQKELPKLRLLSPCPALIERNNELLEINGYDEPSGIWTHGPATEDVPLEEAVELLEQMLSDFRFATPADRARALAGIITPALILGQLVRGRAPVDLGEADASQSGKGYRNKLTATIYRQRVRTVTQKKGGVGSLEESFATALIRGRNFICLDNVRGHIDSPAIESFLTEDSFLARVPHQPAIEIDPRRYIVQLTSNKADITIDLANRSSCVRILKQPAGFRFRKFPEGDMEDHVRAYQPRYLGAVFAVIKAWYAAGKPRTDETRHDFRPWAQSVDWIVRNIFKTGPLLDGHRETQIRMATPILNWLRNLAIAVREADRLDQWLRPNTLLDLMITDVETMDDATRSNALRDTGRKLAQCFKADGSCRVDEFEIERRESADPRTRTTVREFCFRVSRECAHTERPLSTMGANDPESPNGSPNPPAGGGENRSAEASCAHSAPIGAPMSAPMNSAVAPIAPIESRTGETEQGNHHVFDNSNSIHFDNRKVMQPMGAMGALLPPRCESHTSHPSPNHQSDLTRWLTAEEAKSLPANIRLLVTEQPGWSPSAWRDRLNFMSSGCINPDRGEELARAAALLLGAGNPMQQQKRTK